MERNTIEILKQNLCCGCGACQNSCPKEAIEMKVDKEGFYSPVIDHTKCVSCGLCAKACPVLNVPRENDQDPKAYAVKSKPEVMKNSTSAGVFAQMAEYVLQCGGYVCGAAFDENFEVHHILTNQEDGMNRIKKSKYVQSQIGLVYRDIKKLLIENKLVLFSGTPCQVAGLKRFLGKKYENLYTMDIICHGVPSPSSWKRYLSENVDISQLEAIDFRHKGDHGFKKHFISFKYKNGNEDVIPSGKNMYYRYFLHKIALRNSCSHCEFAVFPRQGDISAGDFWGAQKLYPELIESDRGLSVLMVNNLQGENMFEKIKEKFTLIKEITSKEAMTSNRRSVSRDVHVNKKLFMNRGRFMSFNDAVKKYDQKPYDVAIYGNTMGSNYGGRATYYALYKAVQKLGYSPVMLHPPISKDKKIPDTEAIRFSKKHMMVGEPLMLSQFSKYNSVADTFLLGSDQIWNYTLFSGKRTSMYLDFVDNSKKKVSYASSFGFDTPTIFPDNKDKWPVISKLMKQMDYISVREVDGVSICEDYFDVGATHVLDPVFLLDEHEYEEVAKDAVNKPEGKYMAVYVLTPGKQINPAIRFAAKKLNLPRVNMGPGTPEKFERKKKNFDEPYCENLQLEEWMYNIKNSDFVITDSYHCVCFSIIFRKPFILIQKSWAVSRISSLLTKLNLTDRWFYTPDDLKANADILKTPIDYDAVYKILDKEIHKSMSWLRNALASPKVYTQTSLKKPDQYVWKAYRDLYKASDLSSYCKKLAKYQDDFVVAMLNKGGMVEGIEDISFPKKFDFGPRMKSKLDIPLAYICDPQREVVQKHRGDFAHTMYCHSGVRIVVNNDGSTQSDACAFYVEKDGIRSAYTCKDEGLYLLVYSKPADEIVDFVQCCVENGKKISVYHQFD